MTENPAQPREEARRALFEKQKRTLDTLLAHGAITRSDYDRSLTGLREKMGLCAAPADPPSAP